MKRNALPRAGFVALALAGLLVACDNKSPIVPTPSNNPGVPQGGPQSSPLLNLLELSGPSTIAPGSTARFTVTASYGNGSFRDVTAEAAWRINGTSVLSISPGGIVTGLQRGQGSLEASFGGRTSTKAIMVLPDGTFRFTVRVYEARVPVENARVTVVAPASNFEATATGTGGASFYGVAGEVEVRVNAPAYLEYKERLQVVAHQLLDVVPTLENPREFVEGVYALTISAAPECHSTLPAELMQRRYVADIAQIDRGLIMTLMGQAFAFTANRRFNWFRGTLYPDRMTFSLSAAWSSDYYDGYFGQSTQHQFPEVLEEVTPTTFFSMFGSVVVSGPSNRKTGHLDGTIELIGPPPRFSRIAACKSNSHRFELTR